MNQFQLICFMFWQWYIVIIYLLTVINVIPIKADIVTEN